MTNLQIWLYLTLHSFKISNLSIFCVGRNTKYFALRFCTFVVYILTNMHDFFQNFLKHLNMFFNFFKVAGALELGSHCNFPISWCLISLVMSSDSSLPVPSVKKMRANMQTSTPQKVQHRPKHIARFRTHFTLVRA